MSQNPDDATLLQEVQKLQETHGTIGIKKLIEYVKAEHPDWAVGAKRIRALREAEEATCPPLIVETPSGISVKSMGKQRDDAEEDEETIKLHLHIDVPGQDEDGPEFRSFDFLEDIPKSFRSKEVSREVTSAVLKKIIDDCENLIMKKTSWYCTQCGKGATFLWGMPTVALTDPLRPPTITSVSFPVCAIQTRCFQGIYSWSNIAARQMADRTPGGSVYTTKPKASSTSE